MAQRATVAFPGRHTGGIKHNGQAISARPCLIEHE
jgi:hypothetical protein